MGGADGGWSGRVVGPHPRPLSLEGRGELRDGRLCSRGDVRGVTSPPGPSPLRWRGELRDDAWAVLTGVGRTYGGPHPRPLSLEGRGELRDGRLCSRGDVGGVTSPPAPLHCGGEGSSRRCVGGADGGWSDVLEGLTPRPSPSRGEGELRDGRLCSRGDVGGVTSPPAPLHCGGEGSFGTMRGRCRRGLVGRVELIGTGEGRSLRRQGAVVCTTLAA